VDSISKAVKVGASSRQRYAVWRDVDSLNFGTGTRSAGACPLPIVDHSPIGGFVGLDDTLPRELLRSRPAYPSLRLALPSVVKSQLGVRDCRPDDPTKQIS